MKHFLLVFSLLVFSIFTFTSAPAVYSHPMVPSEVLEFFEKNPNATEEEFNQFILDTYGPEALSGLGGNTSESEVNNSKKIVESRDMDLKEIIPEFIKLGIEHIVYGLDHVLFVIALILVLPPWRGILRMITSFTLAHSLTFILAGTNTLSISAKIVEPIIALSIAYMAITTVFFKEKKAFQSDYHKLGVIFLFGLFHGLGFAGVFADLQIPSNNYLSALLFFNVGIELGQIAIILVTIPFIKYLYEEKLVSKYASKFIAVSISMIAIYWFFERIFSI